MTVTAQVSLIFVPSAVAVIVAVPLPFAVTLPSWSTVATFSLSDVHVTFLFVTFDGVNVTVSFDVLLYCNDNACASSLIPVIALFVTVTMQVSVKPPSAVLTVIVAVPGATAVTRPFSSTVAALVLLDVHVTDLFVASAGSTAAASGAVEPDVSDRLASPRETPVTGTASEDVKIKDDRFEISKAGRTPMSVLPTLLLSLT